MQLHCVSIALLIAEAGGDPWAINRSLQAGRPAQISDLAKAFHDAGASTAEADAAFNQALRVSNGPGTGRTASTQSTTPPRCSA